VETTETERRAQCVLDLGGVNRKISAADRRKSEGRYNETVGARGAERASTRFIGNAVEWSQIPRRDATENFMGQNARRSCIHAPELAANVAMHH